ncbi:nucleotidyltransferase family protein [Roseibacterium sp. SDUM158017]|uniref:nucleotidyltransferase family protein n=1 Tax=Roseicyclus salinarum TaxID=3036773 RepID=UPI0024154B17|nr:nucleotidyltransferase family protein [Roseibacterium sp. SDUM158017]MDG4650275.1 nucleotidyltransferase family protein [Roseibacterium sp. SDUM158017]
MSHPCLILAAGFGTRMAALTRDRPKVLIEVAGRPLLAHALEAARAVGAAPIAVNGHYMAAAIEGWLRSNAPDVVFLHESPTILDSGGAVKNAIGALGGGPIFTLNADAVWEGASPLAALAAAWDPARMDALLALVPRARAVGRQGGGDFAMDGAGRLAWDRGPGSPVYVGAQLIDTGRIAARKGAVFSLRETWDAMRAEGRLHGVMHDRRWADVGHPGGIAAAEEMLGHDADL